jgi:hypothetical protein
MTAFLISTYIGLSTVSFIIISILMIIGAMWGTVPMKDYLKAVAFSFIWPVLLGWILICWTCHKIRMLKIGK